MPSEGSSPWAYAGLGAAALFAIGSVTAVATASEQRQAQAQGASSSTSELHERYSAASSLIAERRAEQRQAECELDARVVAAVELEERVEAALESASIVQDAYLIMERVDREAFEQGRAAAVEAFAAGFTDGDDAATAAEYEGSDDPLAMCLAQQPETSAPPAGAVTVQAVEQLEDRAAALGDEPALDTARLDQLDQAVAGLGPLVLQAADARVNVNRLAASGDALGAAAEQLRAQAGPTETLLTLDALVAHAAAALEMQAELEAAQAAEETAETEAPRAPAPEPAPAPQPEPTQEPVPQPEPEPEPEPTAPGNGGGNGGDGGDFPFDPIWP